MVTITTCRFLLAITVLVGVPAMAASDDQWPPQDPVKLLERLRLRDAEFERRSLQSERRWVTRVDPRTRITDEHKAGSRRLPGPRMFGHSQLSYVDKPYNQPHRVPYLVTVHGLGGGLLSNVVIDNADDLETMTDSRFEPAVKSERWPERPQQIAYNTAMMEGLMLETQQLSSTRQAFEWSTGYGFARRIVSIDELRVKVKDGTVVISGKSRVFNLSKSYPQGSPPPPHHDSQYQLELDSDLIVRKAEFSLTDSPEVHQRIIPNYDRIQSIVIETNGIVRPTNAPPVAAEGHYRLVVQKSDKSQHTYHNDRFTFVALSARLTDDELSQRTAPTREFYSVGAATAPPTTPPNDAQRPVENVIPSNDAGSPDRPDAKTLAQQRIEAATQRNQELIQLRELAKQGPGRIEGRVLRVPKLKPVKLDESQKLALERLLPKAGDKRPRLDVKMLLSFPEVTVQSIELHVEGGGVRVFSSAKPDDDGKFVFENVPSGFVMLNPVFRVGDKDGVLIPSALLGRMTVHQGETTTFSLFGKGRPITGRVTLPSTFKPEDCRIELHYSAPPMRDIGEGNGDLKHELAWHVHAVLESEQRGAMLDAQGRFRIEGVREGNYRICVLGQHDGKPVQLAFERQSKPGTPLVKYDGVSLPLMSGGESNEPYDLGTLRCRLDEKSATIDPLDGQLANEKGESVNAKVGIERIAVFVLRFAEAKSALAAMKDKAAIRKIRGFEATIDPRANAVIITADADTLNPLQEILERLDSP